MIMGMLTVMMMIMIMMMNVDGDDNGDDNGDGDDNDRVDIFPIRDIGIVLSLFQLEAKRRQR